MSGNSRTYTDGNIAVGNRVMAAWLNNTNTVVYTLFGNGSEYTGNGNLPGELSVAGNVTVAKKLDVTGNSTLGNLTVSGVSVHTGNSSFGNMTITGNVTQVGEYSQTGNMTVSGTGNLGLIAGAVVATQAQQEAGAAANVVVTPARQQFHPSAAKAFLAFNQVGNSILANYNVAGTTANTGTGVTRVDFTTPMSSANYAVASSMVTRGFITISLKNTGNFSINAFDTSGNPVDVAYISAIVMGDE